MKLDNLVNDLHKLHKQWKADARSFDALFHEGPRWIDGVVYGIGLSIDLVRDHLGWKKLQKGRKH